MNPKSWATPEILESQETVKLVLFIRVSVLVGMLTVPGKMSSAESTPSEDADAVLQRIRARVGHNLSNLHNYTCHEVIERLIRPPNVGNYIQHDRVEVEVAFVGGRELFARPGESNFEEEPLSKLVPTGTVGTGNFGSHTHSIFVGNAASFSYVGISSKDGHKSYHFEFDVPQEKSQFLVKHNGAQVIVGYRGSFWADLETYDLVRLEIKADHIPPSVGVRFISTKMQYAMMQFNDSQFLLPRRSELEASDSDGVYSLDGVTLKQCREYRGDSVVTYSPGPNSSSVDHQSPVQ